MHEPDDRQQRPEDPFGSTGRGSPATPYSAYPAPLVAPRPRQSGAWKPLAIVFGSILGLQGLAVVGLGVVAAVAFADEVTSIALDEAVVERCTDVDEAARAVPLLAGPDAAREPLRELARAADELAATGAGAAENSADREWVQDWRRLAVALEEHADDPTRPFELPERDGTAVTVSLSTNGPLDCEPPVLVSALDPDAADDLYVDDASVF